MRRQENQQPGRQAAAARRADVIAEEFQPVRFVPLLRVGQGQQNLSLLAAPALRQLAVASGLSALVGEVLPPAADLAMARGTRHTHMMATPSLTHISLIGWRRSSMATGARHGRFRPSFGPFGSRGPGHPR